jgi:hypothetical protein
MSVIVILFGLFTAALGLLGLVAPGRLVGFVKAWETPIGLYVAAGLRLVLGIALFLAAPASRAPDVCRILAVVIFAAGVATPFVGLERFRRLLAWWTARGSGFMRAWAGIALILGLFLVWVVTP